jgi:hypothetical protein
MPKSQMKFSEALIALANDDSLDISEGDRRRMKRIADNKRRCKRCEERCEREARKEGKKLKAMGDVYGGLEGEVYGFDWSGLLEFLKGLLPLITQIIAMF